MSAKPPINRERRWKQRLALGIAQFLVLFLLWLIFSGQLVTEFLVLGAIFSAVIAFLTNHLIVHPSRAETFPFSPVSFWQLIMIGPRFALYLPWLLYQIVLANIQVTYCILHPRLIIAPRMIRFDTSLTREAEQVLLANSITLTPGTITVDVKDGRFLVHALSPKTSDGLMSGNMQNKVARVFGEKSGETSGILTINHPDELDD